VLVDLLDGDHSLLKDFGPFEIFMNVYVVMNVANVMLGILDHMVKYCMFATLILSRHS
jgi:hypothetical protein